MEQISPPEADTILSYSQTILAFYRNMFTRNRHRSISLTCRETIVHVPYLSEIHLNIFSLVYTYVLLVSSSSRVSDVTSVRISYIPMHGTCLAHNILIDVMAQMFSEAHTPLITSCKSIFIAANVLNQPKCNYKIQHISLSEDVRDESDLWIYSNC